MHPDMKIKFFGSNTMGEKGQVVVPVEGRQALDLNPGDKLIFMGDVNKGVMIVARAEVFEQHMEQMQAGFKTVLEHINKEKT